MPKLPTRTAKQVIEILVRHGFAIDHVTGSHHIMFHSERQLRITVPMHHGDLKRGALHTIIKQSGLSRADF